MSDGIKSNESCFNIRTERVLHNAVFISVSFEHLQMKNKLENVNVVFYTDFLG